MYADIFPGASVLEAGTGSGSLTWLWRGRWGRRPGRLLRGARGPPRSSGVATSQAWYEGWRGKPENLELRVGDVFEGSSAGETFDRMVLDLPEPWRAVGPTTAALTAGGIICCYLPTIPQVQQTVEAHAGVGVRLIDTFEGLVRTWNVEGQSVRPDHRMVAHTGFLITARKLSD